MAHTQAINEAAPAGSDAASGGAAEFRNLKRDVRERMALEHYWNDDTADTDQKDGGHINITVKGTGVVVNQELFRGTGYSLTGANAQSLLDLAGTWNTSGTPTGIKLNVTDTASNAASLLMDLQVGGVSKFKVDKTGVVTMSNLTSSALIFTSDGIIRRNTADGADSGSNGLVGGGAAGNTRGADFYTFGNEHASRPGSFRAISGNVAGAEFTIVRADGTETLNIDLVDGGTTFVATATSNAWRYVSSHANGAFLTIERGASQLLALGCAEALDASLGTTDDAVLKATTADLYIEARVEGVRSHTIEASTTASAANVVCATDGTGRLFRSTSSRKYKRDIQPLEDWRFLLRLSPITFLSVKDPTGPRHAGFTAEDVASVNLMYVTVNKEREPEGVEYAHLTAPIIAAIQDFEKRLKVLEGDLR